MLKVLKVVALLAQLAAAWGGNATTDAAAIAAPTLAPTPASTPTPAPTFAPTPAPTPTPPPTFAPTPAPTPTPTPSCLGPTGQPIPDDCVAGDGQWYSLSDGWREDKCDDSGCKMRCRPDGTVFKSDYGNEYGDGKLQQCGDVKKVVLTLVIQNVDFSALSADPSTMALFKP